MSKTAPNESLRTASIAAVEYMKNFPLVILTAQQQIALQNQIFSMLQSFCVLSGATEPTGNPVDESSDTPGVPVPPATEEKI